MIYITSDIHFCHDRDYVYKFRGFHSIEEHDKAIIENWNSIIQPDDDVYILGDIVLMNTWQGIEYLKKLNGKIHIIRGNHDTDNRAQEYIVLPNVIEVVYTTMIKYKKCIFYLSHYPTITTNDIDTSPYLKKIINLYGHTHQKTKFYNDNPYMYCVCLDAHDNYPVSIEHILEDIKNKREEQNQEGEIV